MVGRERFRHSMPRGDASASRPASVRVVDTAVVSYFDERGHGRRHRRAHRPATTAVAHASRQKAFHAAFLFVVVTVITPSGNATLGGQASAEAVENRRRPQSRAVFALTKRHSARQECRQDASSGAQTMLPAITSIAPSPPVYRPSEMSPPPAEGYAPPPLPATCLAASAGAATPPHKESRRSAVA